jgi:tight adherence protein B
MNVVLALALALAVLLFLRPPRGAAGRFRRAVGRRAVGRRGMGGSAGSRPVDGMARGGSAGGGDGLHGMARVGGGAFRSAFRGAWPGHGARKSPPRIPLTLVVQQLAALLKGGRTPARLWEELWLVYSGRPGDASHVPGAPGTGRPGPALSPGSIAMLAAARAAAFRGSPVSDAIRISAPAAFPRISGREPRIWFELAACFDIAEASGCPLADVLTRFAAQLEVEDDAEAARQTALAGPKATVSLLTWLPLMGLGLGIALGVDPFAILVGTPLGLAALAAGAALTAAGRIWSSRLVRAAAGAGVT